MTTTATNNRKISDFAYNFEDIVKKEHWVSRYDIESDSLSFTVPKLSNDVKLKYLDDEMAFYFNKNKDIKGIFIEYFKSNFVKHHKDFKQLLKNVDKKKNSKETLVELSKDPSSTKVIMEFEGIIKDSLFK